MASSHPATDWILEGNFNMVEWECEDRGSTNTLISGAKKHAWSRSKATLQIFYPN
jgi:hypothetical protein